MRRGTRIALAAALAAGVIPAARAGAPTVSAGGASVAASGATTIITQTTPKAIYTWQSLNVPAGGVLQFNQPSTSSIALNRVTSGVAVVNGSLLSNGQVWIIDPAGVLFGHGASVNVAGLIATTSDINDQNFLNGGPYTFGQPTTNPSAAVMNYGTISVAPGGSAVLAGARVVNGGLIEAQLGDVTLAGADTFTVDFTGDRLISFAVDSGVSQTPLDHNGNPAAALVANAGTISAAGGEVLLTARAARSVLTHAINTTGMIEATTAYVQNGEIVLDAGDGPVNISGTLDVSGKAAGQTGGTVEATGGTVTVSSGAVIDASGDQGGGSIALGGDFHGAGPLADAQSVTIEPGAVITADAITAGNGGDVAVWSNGTTLFDGSISARGGAQGGNGGYVETSGEGVLTIGAGASVVTAGTGGTWLLDPFSNVTISNAATASVTCSGGASITCSPTADSSILNATSIQNSLTSGSSVTVTTNDSGGTQSGTITVSSPIEPTNSTATSLTLDANSTITVNAEIGAFGSALNVSLASSTGAVTINSEISTNGGSFTASGTQINVSAAIVAAAVSLTAGQNGIIDGAAGMITASGAVTMASAGNITIDAFLATYGQNITLDANSSAGGTPTGSGGIAINATVRTDEGGSQGSGNITLATQNSSTGELSLAADLVTEGGTITINAPMVASNNPSIDTTSDFAYPLGAAVTFNGTVDDLSTNGDTLSVTSGDAEITFYGAVGETRPFNYLNLNGGGNGSTVTTGLDIEAPMQLDGQGANIQVNQSVTINGVITAAPGSSPTLDITAGDSDAADQTPHPNEVTFGISGQINFASASGGTITINYHPSTFPIDDDNFAADVIPGSATFNHYMTITSAADLAAIGDNSTSLGSDFAIGNTTIDLSGVANWTPLGTFTGILNGETGVIANLTINSSATDVGLFAEIGSGGMVENVGLTKVNVTGTGSSSYVGALAGVNDGTISYVFSTGTVSSSGSSGLVGGLIGTNNSSIANSYSTASVIGGGVFVTAEAGGLVGGNNGTITQSYASGEVQNGDQMGGLVGFNYGSITDSYANGEVLGGSSSTVGGLVGTNDATNPFPGTISESYASGEVSASGAFASGGLVAINQNGGTVSNSYWDTVTTGQSTSAGGTGLSTMQMASQASYSGAWDFTNTWYLISGMAHPILRSELGPYVPSFAAISSAHQLELIGQSSQTLAGYYFLVANISMAELTNPSGPWLVSSNASIDGGAYGFVPVGNSTTPFTGTLEGDGFQIKNLTIASGATYVGLFGQVGNGTGGAVQDLNLANATITGLSTSFYVGGVAGYNDGGTIEGVSVGSAVTNASTEPNLGGTSPFNYPGAGGVVGLNAGTIENSSYGGTVILTDDTAANVGGVAGWNTGTISQSYGEGEVSGNSNASIGGLVGLNAATVSNSYSGGQAVTATGTNNNLGGLVGLNYTGSAQITDSFSFSYVSGPSGQQSAGGLVALNQGTVTNSYWDTNTSGQGTSAAGTGLTTATLQGALQTGFSGSVWGLITGVSYPYLLSIYPSTPQVVSGTAYSGINVNPIAGELVSGQVDGQMFSETLTGANGYYYFLEPNGEIPSVNGQLIVSSLSGGFNYTEANTFVDNADGTVTGVNLDATSLRLISSGASASGILNDLATAVGSGGTGIGFTLGANNVPVLPAGEPALAFIGSGTTLNLDVALALGSDLLIFFDSASTSVTQSQPFTAGSLTLGGPGASYSLTNTSNSFASFAASTGSASIADSEGFNVTSLGPPGSQTVGATLSGNLVINDPGTVIESNPISASGLALIGGGTYTLNTQTNSIGTVAANAASVNLTSSGTLTINPVGSTAVFTTTGSSGLSATSIALGSSAAVTIAGGTTVSFTAGTGGSITEASGGTVSVGSGATLQLYANTLTLAGAGSFTGSGIVSLRPLANTDTIGVGSGSGTLQISQTTLNAFGGGIGLGIGDGGSENAAVSIGGPVTFPVTTQIFANGGSNGTIDLSGTIESTGQELLFNGPVVLTSGTTVDTTDAGTDAGGALVSFLSTIDGAPGPSFVDSLTVTAGSGDIDFAGRVGFDNNAVATAVSLGGVSLTTTGNVNMTMPTNGGNDGFSAASFSASDVASFTSDSYINTHGESGGTNHPNGGAISITSTGAISIALSISSGGGINTSTLAGGGGGTITVSAGGAISIGGSLGSGSVSVLANGYTAGTSDSGATGQTAGSGANVSITGTSITIGTSIIASGGNATANGELGSGGSAGSVSLTSTTGDITIGSSNSTGNEPASIAATGGSTNATGMNAGNGNTVNVQAHGNFSTTATIATVGGEAGPGGVGGNGGEVEVTAGGAVTIGNGALTLISQYQGSLTKPEVASILTRGGETNWSSAAPGNGGIIDVMGASISLPFGASSGGGDATDLYSSSSGEVGWASTAITTPSYGWTGTASTANGGTAGALTLDATSGPVTVGTPAGSSSTSTGALIGLFARGGDSTGGNGGNGAPVTVTGTTISVARVFSRGGDTLAPGPATGGTGSSIILDATSAVAGAITLYGNSDPATAVSTGLQTVLTARSGYIDMTAFGNISAPAVLNGTAGSVSLTVPSGGTIVLASSTANTANVTTTTTGTTQTGASGNVITGVTSTAGFVAGEWISGPGIPADAAIISVGTSTITINAFVTSGAGTGTITGLQVPNGDNNGSTVAVSASGGVGHGGAVTFTGPIEGATGSAGVESLRILIADGSFHATSTIGASVPLAAITIGGGVSTSVPTGGSGGAVTFTGAVTVDSEMLDLGDGSLTFNGLLTTPNLTTDGASVAINDGAVFSGTFAVESSPALPITVGGDLVFDTNLGGAASGNFILSSATTFDFSSATGNVTLSGTIDDSTAGSQSFTFNAPTGGATITMTLGGTTALGAVTLNGPSLAFSGAITTASGAVTINTPTMLNGVTSIDATAEGTSTGAAITFASTLDGDQALTLRTGVSPCAACNVFFEGVVGGNQALGALSVTATNLFLYGNLSTAGGSVTDNSALTLRANATVATNAGTPAGANVLLNGGVNANATGAQSLTINAGTGGTVTLNPGGINGLGGSVPLGSVAVNAGSIALDANVTTASGAVSFNAPVTLETSVTIDTTNAAHSSGAAVTFGGTLDGASGFADNLTVTAGSGVITFDERVGYDGLVPGVTLGAVSLTTTGAVTMSMAPLSGNTDGFSAGAVTINAGSLTTTSFISTHGGTGTGGQTAGGNISITTSGNVSIAGELIAGGGVNTSTGSGGNGGSVTINASGTVSVGSILNPTTNASINNTGYTASAGQTAGSSGPISVTGTSITLYANINSSGGNAVGAGTAGNGGNVTLDATSGSITMSSTAFPADAVGIDADSGTSPSGANGTGGTVMITTTGGGITATGGIETSALVSGGITINAGGAVQLGSLFNPNTSSALFTAGMNAASGAGGAGGNISVTGTVVDLFADAISRGGAGAGSNAGGGAGTIALTATTGDVVIQSTAFPTTTVNVFAYGGNSGSTGSASGGIGNAVTIQSTNGNVTISGQIDSVGGSSLGSGAGGASGAVTVEANNAVSIGSAIPIITRYANNSIQTQEASIASRGANTLTSSSSPSNGGNVLVTGASINLPFGVSTSGGSAVDEASSPDVQVAWASTAVTGWTGTASTANGGSAGTITLTASGGAITIGNPAGSSTTSTGSLVGLFANGGYSTGGAGGSGNTVTVSGGTVSLAKVFTAGGDTASASSGGNAGAISITATSAVAGAITLYGNSDPPLAATTMSQTSINARGGDSMAAATGSFGSAASPAVLSGLGGNVTLSVPAGGTIVLATSTANTSTATTSTTGTTTSGSNQITSVASTAGLDVGEWITGTGIPAGTAIAAINSTTSIITLTANATASGTVAINGVQVPNGVNNGTTVALSDSGGLSTTSTMIVNGAINGSVTSNTQNLRILTGDATATFANAIGAGLSLESVSFGNGVNTILPPGGNGGTVTFSGAVTVGTEILDQRTSGTEIYNALVTAPNLTMDAGTTALQLNAGATLGSLVNSGGTVTLGGTLDITGGGLSLSGALVLSSNATIETEGDLTLSNSVSSPAYTIDGSGAGGQSFTIDAAVDTVVLDGLIGSNVALGAVTVNAQNLDFNGANTFANDTLTTKAQPIAFNVSADVTLNVPLVIDVTGTGGNVTFNTTQVNGGTAYDDGLTINAGSSGTITFSNIGGTTRLGGLSITDSSAVIFNSIVNVASLNVAGNGNTPGAATVTAAFSINTDGSATAGQPAGGGNVDIVTTGAVTITDSIFTDGGGNGGSGGNVTINAGGAVSIGSGITLATSGSGGTLTATSSPAVLTNGFVPTTSAQTAGNAGTISITGTSLTFYQSVVANGSNATVAGSSANGGNAGAITLTATAGSVTIGSAATGNLIGVFANGGNSLGGAPGAGANVTISGQTITLSKVSVNGGDSELTSTATTLPAGNITLIASAASGDAVLLLGNGNTATTSISGESTLSALGGEYSDTNLTTAGALPNGLTTGAGGNITIEGGVGVPLNGTADIRLINNSSNASLNGGPTVIITSAGGLDAGGTITINGPIAGTTANTENLRIGDYNGTATVSGSIGTSSIPLAQLTIGPSTNLTVTYPSGSTAGAFTIAGAVTAQTVDEAQTSGSLTFNGLVTTADFESASGTETVTFNGGTDFTGGVTLSGGDIVLTANDTIDTSATNSPITIEAPIDATTAGVQTLTINAGSGTVTIDSVLGGTTPLGAVTVTGGLIDLSTSITTKAGAVTFNGPTVLTGNTSIDTSAGGGATVAFNGTVDAASFGVQTLAIAAGAAGNINFTARVGYEATSSPTLGCMCSSPGAVTITSANAVNLTMPYGNADGFAVGSLSITGVASVSDTSFITTSNIASNDNGGPVTITATGAVAIGTGIPLDITSGEVTSENSINTSGAGTQTAGQPAGNGGNVTITAASINLPFGIEAKGGTGKVSGTPVNGGNGGTITLTAAGGTIDAGSLTAGPQEDIDAGGGNSIAGSGGAGGNITLTGANLFIASIASSGGETQAASASGDNAGSITLIATASSGAAVVLYGTSNTTTGIASNSGFTLLTIGGEVSDPTAATGCNCIPTGTVNGAGGAVVIEGSSGGAALAGSAFIELQNSTSTAGGGPTVLVIASGASGEGGSVTFKGPVQATTAGLENLHFEASNGSVTIAGPVGTSTKVGTLALGFAPGGFPTVGNNGAVTFDGAVTAGTAITDLRTGGSLAFDGVVTTPSFAMTSGATTLSLTAGASFTGPVTFSGGAVTLAGTFGFSASGLNTTSPISLSGATTLNSSGALTLDTVDSAGAVAEAFTVNAGSSAVTFDAGIGAGKPLGAVTITGGVLTLDGIASGAVTATGSGAITVEAPISSTGAVSLDATGGNLVLDGSVTGTSSGNAVVLATANAFINNAGSNALVANGGGRWLVWSQNPSNDTLDGLVFGFKQYDATFNVTTPAQAAGNGLLYSFAPTVTGLLVGTVSKPYDGTTAATLTAANYQVSGAVGGDTVTLNDPVSGTYASPTAGSGIAVTVTGVAIASASNGGAPVYGYQLASSTIVGNTIGTIGQIVVTLTGTRTYDGTASAAGSILSITDLIPGDVITLSGAATLASKNAGLEAITSANTLSLIGTDANDYTLSGLTGSVTINKAPLTLTAATNTKTYDGTNSALATPAIGGLQTGDTVTGLGESYTTKNAGSSLTLTVNGGYSVNDGNGGNNYTITTVANTTGVINPLAVVLTGTKTFDATATAAGAILSVSNLVAGDAVSLTGSANLASANAGLEGITSTASLGLAGASAPNYTLTSATGSVTVNPLPVILTGSRTYDATTGAAAGILTISNNLSGGNLTLGGTSGVLTSANAGSEGFASAGTLALTGSAASNYTLSGITANGSAVTITPATLTYTATPASSLAGAAIPPLTGTVTGFVGFDSLASATTGAALFTTTATTASPVGAYPVTGSGLTANFGNYTFVQAAGNATAFTLTASQIVAGSVFSDHGSTALSGATVGLILNAGTSEPSVISGAGGAYEFVLPAGTITNTGLFVYLTSGGLKGNSFYDGATGSVTGLDIYGNYFRVLNAPATLSGTGTALAATLNGFTSPNFLFGLGVANALVLSGDNFELLSPAPTFTIDQSVNAASFAVTASQISLADGVTTSGAQTYDGAALVPAGGFTASASTIVFTGTIDGSGALTLGAPGGTVTLDGAVGSTTPLGPVTITANGMTIASGITTASGTVTLNGTVTLASNVTINTDGTGADVDLMGPVNGGSDTLTLITGTGDVTLSGVTVGALMMSPPPPLVTLDSGSYDIGSGSYTFGAVALNGTLSFGQATSFGPATVLSATTITTANEPITFLSTVTGSGATPLTVNAGTGAVTFDTPPTGVSVDVVLPPNSNALLDQDVTTAIEENTAPPPDTSNSNTTTTTTDTGTSDTGTVSETGATGTGTGAGTGTTSTTGTGGVSDETAAGLNALQPTSGGATSDILPLADLTDSSTVAPSGTTAANTSGTGGSTIVVTGNAFGVTPAGETGGEGQTGGTTTTGSQSQGVEQPGASTDGETSSIALSLGGTPTGQGGTGQSGTDKKQKTGNTNKPVTLVNGVLVEAPPQQGQGNNTPHGVPPADQEYSSWGNEAFWQ